MTPPLRPTPAKPATTIRFALLTSVALGFVQPLAGNGGGSDPAPGPDSAPAGVRLVPPALPVLSNQAFRLEFAPAHGGLTSLKRTDDPDGIEHVRPGKALGQVVLRYRTEGGPWREAGTGLSAASRTDNQGEPIASLSLLHSFTDPTGLPELELRQTFALQGEALTWSLLLTNTGARTLEIGDLVLPLPMNTDYTWNHEETFTRRLFRHAFIAGQGSFLYWTPVKGTGSFLVMMPMPGTGLEYFTSGGADYAFGRDQYAVFVHSAATRELQTRGTWRQPATRCRLSPGAGARSAFVFRWAQSYGAVRQLLYANGGVDVQVAPGMVVPQDQEARLALRARRPIAELVAEFPSRTSLRRLGQPEPDTHVYQVRFRRLGENLLSVRFRDGSTLPLEFFSTEPVETLIRKRAAFISAHQQHRDPAQWFDGLFSLWDTRQPDGLNLLGPDHTAGQPLYAVSGSDDPSNGKALLLAEKNVAYPEAAEVAALEYFAKNFVWGKHQRTAQEQPYPCGIYGADHWKQNRFADRDPLDQGISRPGGPSACRMWRTFDYTTYFALYFDLYRIARQRPDLTHYLDAPGYLERAYGTARAYFEVPRNIRMEGGWSFTGYVYWQYTVGNFHEKYLVPLIAALEREGQHSKADYLRGEWEKKVKYFIYDNRWPFVSEMPIDSTAYESAYAAGHYALTRSLGPDTNLWHDRNLNKWHSHPVIDPRAQEEFLRRQHWANLACRGVLEASYWSLGSDFRGCGSASYTLSYMSQMGGWSVLDYALRHDPDPAANLRLGYASLLSAWALMNTGTEDSRYGFWAPGRRHDGALGWGFQPRQIGDEWNPAMRSLPRGAWPVCGEADHGLVAGIEAARTVLFDDPLFGLVAYGGELTSRGSVLKVIPRDGVRQRFSLVLGAQRLHLELEQDGFAAGHPVCVRRDLASVLFRIENRAGKPHEAGLTVEGLPSGRYRLACDTFRQEIEIGPGRPTRLTVRLSHPRVESVSIRRLSP